jgi:hypothetical protein
MTQNSQEAGMRNERIERPSYDARTVQKGSNGIEGDWRKNDDRSGGRSFEPSTPRGGGDRGGDSQRRRSDQRDRGDHEPQPMTREQKLQAMDGDTWKKKPFTEGRQQKSERRDMRDYGEEPRGSQQRRDTRDYGEEPRVPQQQRSLRNGYGEKDDRRDGRDDRRDGRDDRRDGRDDRRDTTDRRHRDDRRDGRDDRRDPTDRVYRETRDHEPTSWPGDHQDSRGGKARAKEFKDSGDKQKCFLTGEGARRLSEVLNREFEVCPRQDANRKPGFELPKLKVQAGYLIQYVVGELMEEGGETEEEVECQIYGGEARAIVAAEHKVEDKKSRPTDLDLRFKIAGRGFESCRDVVERFLLGRLITQGVMNADEQLIRQHYFQKQVVVGQDFSLLSIGDSGTGKNLDLEFTTSKCDHRCFFDDANAFVIPLPDPAHMGWKFCQVPQGGGKGRGGNHEGTKLWALSQSAPWQTAVRYIERGQLNIDKPENVFNGLPLYAHALSDKQLTPETKELEHEYGKSFSEKFLEQAEQTCSKGDDPLRFIKSFLKSHYPSRPLNALACLSQILAVLRAHAVLDTLTEQRQTIAQKIGEHLAELCREAIQKANTTQQEKLLQVVRFAAHPFSDSYHSRDENVMNLKEGQNLRLRRQVRYRATEELQDGAQLWEGVCTLAAEHLERKMKDDELDEPKRAHVEEVCEALKGLGMSAPPDGDDGSHQEESSDDEGIDRRSAVASSQKSQISLSSSRHSLSSSTMSNGRVGDCDESSSQGSGNEVDNYSEEAEGASSLPDASRKSPQVSVQLPVDGDSPSPPSPASAAASMSNLSIDSCPGTPSSTTSSKTPTSDRRRPNWGAGPYRPPARRSATPGGTGTPSH